MSTIKKEYKNNYLTKWIEFWIFAFSISVLALPGHGGQSAIVLLLTMLYISIFKNSKMNTKAFFLRKEEKVFVYLVSIWFFLQLFGVIFQPEGYEFDSIRVQFRALDNPARWLLLLPVFFLFRRYLVDWKFLAIGIGIGILITVSVAHYEVYFLNLDRAEGMSNHYIPFGELMVVADLLLWAFMAYAWNNSYKILSYFLLFASAIAFYGSLLSVTRGALIVYMFVILLWIFYLVKNNLYKNLNFFNAPFVLRLLFMFVIFFAVSQTKQYETLKDRTTSTINDISNKNYNYASSGRLVIYKDAINSINKYPFGIGTDNFKKIDLINGYSYNAHNQLLNIWVENGIQGVVSIVLLIGYLIIFFWGNLKCTDKLIGVYALSGLILIFSYIIFSATQVIFAHQQTLLFFIFYLYLLFAQINLIKKNNNSKKT